MADIGAQTPEAGVVASSIDQLADELRSQRFPLLFISKSRIRMAISL
jgi:hypothetical protein